MIQYFEEINICEIILLFSTKSTEKSSSNFNQKKDQPVKLEGINFLNKIQCSFITVIINLILLITEYLMILADVKQEENLTDDQR